MLFVAKVEKFIIFLLRRFVLFSYLCKKYVNPKIKCVELLVI